MAETGPAAPDGVLGEIVAATRRRLKAGKAATSLESMLERCRPSGRRLAEALSRPGLRSVLEMKRRSPSRGDLRPGATVSDVAAAYRGLADAVSVLTEPEFFGGSLEDLSAMRDLTDVPILRKDFILDPWQVVEARLHGADAVLLMLSVLGNTAAEVCLAMCELLSMDALLEVHDQEELQRGLDLGAEMNDTQILGINNRDLTSLEVDLATTERLAAAVPADRLLVAESGIGSRADVARLAPCVDAMLVGSSLMQASDLRGAAADLSLGRFKICGLTRSEDAIAACGAGAWRLGAVLAPDSPRCTTPRAARAMAEVTGIEVVAVFRSQPIDEIVELARRSQVRTIQIHQPLSAGHVSAEDIGKLRQALPGIEIWAVYAVEAGRLEAEALPTTDADRLLIDAAVNGRSGGTGRRVDLGEMPNQPGWDQVIVAGGITPESAAEILATGPYAIDLSSSLETEPGIKDHEQIERLRASLRPPGRRENA